MRLESASAFSILNSQFFQPARRRKGRARREPNHTFRANVRGTAPYSASFVLRKYDVQPKLGPDTSGVFHHHTSSAWKVASLELREKSSFNAEK